MALKVICNQCFQRYRSAWFVGVVFALLIVFGLIWRGLYLHFFEDQIKQHQVTENLIVKSNYIEKLIISARNRSVIVSQMLFLKNNKDQRFADLVQRFEREAVVITELRQAYFSIADDYEKQLLNQHYELASVNRVQQDYLLTLLQEGEYEQAIQEYTEISLPILENALALLDALHAYIAQQREINKQRIDADSNILMHMLQASTAFYLIFLFAMAVFVIQRLVKLSRVQEELQAQLSDQLVVKTVAYEQADKELVRLAHFDVVTNLYNRRYFEHCLQDSLRECNSFSLLLIDLDNFKWFNDTLGHAVGDELLNRFAHQLQAVDSPIAEGIVARVGGDEFAIILADTSPEEEQEVIRFLLASIAELDEHYGPAKALNASIGIARFPDHAQAGDLLMRFADVAMYQAKALGKGRAVVFDTNLLQAMYDELDLEQALKQALQEEQLQVFYQAQYRLSDLQLSGVEALMRWQRFGQWVSPALLIPLAEKTGHIHALGLQILEKVLVDIQRWDAQSQHVPKVAVNVSPVQMRLEHSYAELLGRIDASGVDSTRIEVEITENAFADSEVCFSFIQHLAQRQIRIALDDFGTGYSSLSQITKLNIDTLKIDQSFVSQLEHSEKIRVLVKTIIQMGHGLGLTLLAEGIETQAQYELLKEWGCDEGQGYLFARPVPADQFSFESPTLC